MSERVVILGQGYVGLPLAMRSVEAGFDVVGFEADAHRAERLAHGHSHVEDVSDALLAAALSTGRYRPSVEESDLAGFDIAIISVPTPMKDGLPDLTFIEESARTLGRYLRRGATVVLESTTWPGTTEELVAPILEEGSGLRSGADFHLGYSPERIDPGNPTWNLFNTPKVVSGVDDRSLKRVTAFFDQVVERTVAVSGTREAELTKLLENTFRHVNIALVNELAMFAHDLGINIWDAIDAASTKPFGYLRFTPGPGVGGHCLPIDPSYLSWHVERSSGRSFRFIELANDVNEHMPDYVVRRAQSLLNDRERSVKGSTIVCMGLAYKANTGDARETPSVPVCEQLLELGALVQVVDPHVADRQFPTGVTRIKGTTDDLAAADLIVYLVDHDAFDHSMIAASPSPILDCRHVLEGPNVHVL